MVLTTNQHKGVLNMFGYFPRRIPFIIPIAFFLGVMASSALGGIGGVGFGLFFALPFLLFKIFLMMMFFRMFFGFARFGYGPRGSRGDRPRQPKPKPEPTQADEDWASAMKQAKDEVDDLFPET
jgi:hypothetical protein